MPQPYEPLPVAVVCPKCEENYFADLERYENPNDTPCPRCGFAQNMGPDGTRENEPPTFID